MRKMVSGKHSLRLVGVQLSAEYDPALSGMIGSLAGVHWRSLYDRHTSSCRGSTVLFWCCKNLRCHTLAPNFSIFCSSVGWRSFCAHGRASVSVRTSWEACYDGASNFLSACLSFYGLSYQRCVLSDRYRGSHYVSRVHPWVVRSFQRFLLLLPILRRILPLHLLTWYWSQGRGRDQVCKCLYCFLILPLIHLSANTGSLPCSAMRKTTHRRLHLLRRRRPNNYCRGLSSARNPHQQEDTSQRWASRQVERMKSAKNKDGTPSQEWW